MAEDDPKEPKVPTIGERWAEEYGDDDGIGIVGGVVQESEEDYLDFIPDDDKGVTDAEENEEDNPKE